jgi:HD-like signal output (HDOD) protein
MSVCAETNRTDLIVQDLDLQRKKGVLGQLVIPPCPTLLVRLQQVMAATPVDLNEVAHIAAQDVAMAAVLLRAANTPRYGRGQPAQTLGQALNLLGLNQTAQVMTTFLTRQALPVNTPHLHRFWQRAGIRARAMELLAERLPGLSPDLAYTCGLFCHVGQPVMLQSVRGYSGTLVEAAARQDRSPVATENANHRTDHAVVGALVVRTWKLAPSVMAAVRLHHDLEVLGDGSVDAEVQTLVAAGLLAENLMHRDEGVSEDRDWAQFGTRALEWLDIKPTELDQWQDELALRLDRDC